MNLENIKISVIGLGYVGLPLAVAFARKFNVVGYDIDESRINDLNEGNDKTLEVENDQLDCHANVMTWTFYQRLQYS